MRSDRCLVNTRLAVLGVVVMFSCVCTWAAAPARDAGSNSQSASWAAKDLDFAYRGFTTKYSCDGLQQKMRRVLTRLGARADMQLRAYGCTDVARLTYSYSPDQKARPSGPSVASDTAKGGGRFRGQRAGFFERRGQFAGLDLGGLDVGLVERIDPQH